MLNLWFIVQKKPEEKKEPEKKKLVKKKEPESKDVSRETTPKPEKTVSRKSSVSRVEELKTESRRSSLVSTTEETVRIP